MDTVLVGISRDSVVSHRNFAAVHELKPPLIADQDGAISTMLGILPDPEGHPKRTTFVIDKAGVVRYIFESVKVPGHAQEVLETVREMNSKS